MSELTILSHLTDNVDLIDPARGIADAFEDAADIDYHGLPSVPVLVVLDVATDSVLVLTGESSDIVAAAESSDDPTWSVMVAHTWTRGRMLDAAECVTALMRRARAAQPLAV